MDEQIPQIKPENGKSKDLEDVNPHKISLNTAEKGPTKKRKIKLPKFRLPKFTGGNKKKIYIILGAVGIVFVLLLFILVIPLISVYKKGTALVAKAQSLQTSVEAQDMGLVKQEVVGLRQDLESFQLSYKALSWTSVLPVLGSYWRDGDAAIKAGLHGADAALVLIETAEPYADIIGFAGADSKEASDGEESANDRIEFLIRTIEDITPKMDEISGNALLAKEEIDKINPSRYPKTFRGVVVRDKLKKIIDLSDQATTFLASSKPLMEVAPYLLGIDESRTYLLIFQNDKELRPTGGFITAYSIMQLDNGKFTPVSSSDIYKLDDQYTPTIEAPKTIINYIQGPYTLSRNWRLRDMNWSPDFAVSMDLFAEEAAKAGLSDYDGIIAVDTEVVVKILDVLGQIGVPGFGNFGTDVDPRCDCPQVIYELESFADVEGPIVWSENEPGKIVFAPPNYDNRKRIVGPLMNSVLSNALGQPKEKLPDLFQAAWESVTEKHVMLYMFDEKAQSAVEEFGIAGRIEDFDGDYLHINDSNLGGRKSNLYVTQEVSQVIEVQGDGSIVKTLSITYNNPQEQDGWLNSVLPNWTRVYVPKGSELLSVEGFEDKEDPYEDLGKTVFAGGFELRPKGIKRIIIKYKLPFKAEGDTFRLYVQKQSGLDAPLYSIELGNQLEELFLKTDKEFKFGI